jgi:hypothetical protein
MTDKTLEPIYALDIFLHRRGFLSVAHDIRALVPSRKGAIGLLDANLGPRFFIHLVIQALMEGGSK